MSRAGSQESLLEKFKYAYSTKADNTHRAYITDVSIYFREVFLHFWDFPVRYNPLAREIAASYLGMRIQEQHRARQLSDAQAGRLLERTRALPQQRSTQLALPKTAHPQKPYACVDDGRLIMRLEPVKHKSIDEYIQIRKEDKRMMDISFRQYADLLDDRFFMEAFGLVRVGKVFDHLREEHGNSNNTLCRKLSALRKFEKFLLHTGTIHTLQLPLFDHPTRQRNEQEFLNHIEMQKVLEQAHPTYRKTEDRTYRFELRDRALMELMYGVGLRVSSVVSARIRDLDLENAVIKVVTKGGHERRFHIPSQTTEYLQRYLVHRNQIHPNIQPEAEDVLFINRHGGPIDRKTVYRIVEKYVDDAGIKRTICPHSFRRSGATALKQAGADIVEVRDFLAHKSVVTTEVYLGRDATDMKEVLRQHHPRGRKRAGPRKNPRHKKN